MHLRPTAALALLAIKLCSTSWAEGALPLSPDRAAPLRGSTGVPLGFSGGLSASSIETGAEGQPFSVACAPA